MTPPFLIDTLTIGENMYVVSDTYHTFIQKCERNLTIIHIESREKMY